MPILGAFLEAGIGPAHSFESFLTFDLMTGVIGGVFFVTQYKTMVMFAPNMVALPTPTLLVGVFYAAASRCLFWG